MAKIYDAVVIGAGRDVLVVGGIAGPRPTVAPATGMFATYCLENRY
jgi:hypothetical protein